MTPGLRKLALTAHITSSVGWLGAVAGFLTLAIIGLTSEDAQLVRAIYLVAEPMTRFAIVPLALASLLTGIIQSLGTPWGLFRHYWVLIKFMLTVFATIVLLMYIPTVDYLANVAAKAGASLDELRTPTFVLHSGGGLLVLLVTTVLSVYKPRGMTRFGQRKQDEQRRVRLP